MEALTYELLSYARDHAETFPPSISELMREDPGRFDFETSQMHAYGDRVRSWQKVDIDVSPSVAAAFSDYSFIVTGDRCHLVVFEHPGIWDDHQVGYVDVNLRGRWDEKSQHALARVSEQAFADFLASIDRQPAELSPPDALVHAAEIGDTSKVAELLASGVPVDGEDGRGWTALTIATESGRRGVVQLLISMGAKPNVRDDSGLGRTALMRAAALGYEEIVDDLISHGADVRVKLEDGTSALLEGLEYPSIEKKLIAAGADPREQTTQDWSPLIAACAGSNAGTVRALIEGGADIRRDGPRSLEEASKVGNSEAIALLLAHGFTPTKDQLNDSLTNAYAYPGTLKLLIKAGANVNAICQCCGRTTLMISGINGDLAAVNALLAAGADVNAKDARGHTVLDLMLAAVSSDSEFVTAGSRRKSQMDSIIATLQAHGAVKSGLHVEWPESTDPSKH